LNQLEPTENKAESAADTTLLWRPSNVRRYWPDSALHCFAMKSIVTVGKPLPPHRSGTACKHAPSLTTRRFFLLI